MSIIQIFGSSQNISILHNLLSWHDSKQLRACAAHYRNKSMWFKQWNIIAMLYTLDIGSKIDAKDQHGKWYEAYIIEYNFDYFTHDYYINIHYCAWSNKWDDQICNLKEIQERIAIVYSHTHNYRKDYSIGKLYEFRNSSTQLWHMGIIECIDYENDLVKIKCYNNSNIKSDWIYKNSDHICDVNTHIKLKNRQKVQFRKYYDICVDYYDKRNLYQLLYTNHYCINNPEIIPIIINQKRIKSSNL